MNTIFKNLVPSQLKNFIRKRFESERLVSKGNIPNVQISEMHISNLKAVKNREALLSLLPKNAIVAEIGVDKGEFSEMIIRTTCPKRLHLIDTWNSERYPDSLSNQVEEKFKMEIIKKQIEINRGLSTEVGLAFRDGYFDWVYIDTDHSYLTTKAELELYSKKVRPGGIIAGHDFITGNWIKGIKYGVKEAVYEFCVSKDWEIILLTMENTFPASFAIRELKEK